MEKKLKSQNIQFQKDKKIIEDKSVEKTNNLLRKLSNYEEVIKITNSNTNDENEVKNSVNFYLLIIYLVQKQRSFKK